MRTNTDEKLLLARLGDLEQRAKRGGGPCFSRFLDAKEIAVFHANMRPSVPFMLWGGYDESERQMLGFFPGYPEPEESAFPITPLRLKSREELSHRAVLGSVMGLGVERNLIGDVAKEETGAVLFVCDSICDYIAQNLLKIGQAGVQITPAADDLCLLPRAWQPVTGTVASLRLDCVLGLLTGASRGRADEMIRSEKVQVNHSVCTKNSVVLAVGDVLSVRGFGRAELLESLGETKKGRIRITLKKYI